MRLIHYGASEFDPLKFKEIVDAPEYCKPCGGLWSSPVDSHWGWKDWSDSEDFGDTSTFFEFDFYGRLFVVDSISDMDELPWISDRWINFELLVFMGYDGIHLTEKGQEETRFTYPKSLYGWDCETVLIFNKDCIQ